MISKAKAMRLKEIREEMMELLKEAERLLRSADRLTRDRAESYWLAHIKSALGNENYPMHAVTFEDTLKEVHPEGLMCPDCEDVEMVQDLDDEKMMICPACKVKECIA